MVICPLLLLACVAPQGKTFTSRSGEMRLEVEDLGDGTSVLGLRDSGGQRWARTVPHSLAGVYVCEDGIVVANGIKRIPEARGPGSHALTILGPHGEPRLAELLPILWTSVVGPSPDVQGLLVWESIDTCAFWIENRGDPDQLWTYSLAGARERVIEPEALLARAARQDWDANILEARPLNGTNLFLATFRCRNKMQGSPESCVSHNKFGAAALLDTGGELLWWELLPKGQFLGSLRELSSSKDEQCWEAGVFQVVEGTENRRPPDYEFVGHLPLRFQRDANGVWLKR